MKKRNKQTIKKSTFSSGKLNRSMNVNNKPKSTNNKNSFLSIIKNNIWIILILFLTLLIYSNAIKNDFVNWDDSSYVQNNPHIKSLDLGSIKKIFTEPYYLNYHPFTTLTYAIEFSFFKLNPHPYHFFNVLLHLINTLLVFLLIKKITKRIEVPLITALLFAIHPFHVESVAWISERKDVLYAMFFLLSLIFYISYQKKNKNISYLIIAFILFVASLMSKSAAVTLPLIILLLSYHINKKIIIKDWLYALPFFALSFIFGVIAIKTQKESIEITNINEIYTFFERILLICFSLYFYIIRFIIPFGFSALHPYPSTDNIALPTEYYFAPVFLILLIVIIFITKKEFRSILIFGLLFFITTIFLIIQIIPLGHAVVSERYTYIPYIGLSFIISNVIALLYEKNFKVMIIILTIPYLIFLSISTFEQTLTWKNSESLWTKVIEVYPHSYIAYNNIGLAKVDKKLYDAAIQNYTKAIEMNVKYPNPYNNRGNVKTELGDIKGAIEDYSKAIAIKSDYSNAYYNRGIARAKLSDIKGAIEDYDEAILLNSKYSEAYNNRGYVLALSGSLDKSLADFDKAISLDSNYLDAYSNRGNVLSMIGRLDDALRDYKKAIKLKPNYYQVYDNIASLYFNKGDFKHALQYYNSVIKIAPQLAHGYYNCGNTKYKLNDLDGACADWNTALKLGDESASKMLQMYCHQ